MDLRVGLLRVDLVARVGPKNRNRKVDGWGGLNKEKNFFKKKKKKCVCVCVCVCVSHFPLV